MSFPYQPADPRPVRLWTALVTPMLPSGGIDYASLTTLLRAQAQAGNGVVLLGSTGEGANLSLAERRLVMLHACGLGLKLPILAGVGGLELEAQKDWLSFCESLPLSGYLMVTPLYAKPGADGQRRWFETLMNAVSRPCMLYNVPSRAGVQLAEAALDGLRGHANLWAVKEASGDPVRFAAYRERFPELAWYSGDDALFGEHARLGAAGLVSVAANIWPQQVAQWLARCLAGDTGMPGALLKAVSEPLFVAANPVPTKALLAHLGLIASAEPRLPLSAADLPGLDGLLAAHAQAQGLPASQAA
ncbi:MAG: 4-hydroxy-tetrahydrodipicolinate synthase [Gammaproteobacteria bacterium]|nr:4-hydroxy-tetrahydrodipicolinate synthase [Gammaproteobacteria bacterium]